MNKRNTYLISMLILGFFYEAPVFASKLTINVNGEGILIPQICAWNASRANLCPSSSGFGGCSSGSEFSYDTKPNQAENVCFSTILSFLEAKITLDTSCSASGFVANVKKNPLGTQLNFYRNGIINGGVRLEVNVISKGSSYVASCQYTYTK
jgi:hypothetical protein